MWNHLFYQALILPVIIMFGAIQFELWYIKIYEILLYCNYCLCIYMCVRVEIYFPGVSAEVRDGYCYMKAVFKKNCPCIGVRSNHKWAKFHHLLTNENKTFITFSTLAFLYLWYIPRRFPCWIKFQKQRGKSRGKFK